MDINPIKIFRFWRWYRKASKFSVGNPDPALRQRTVMIGGYPMYFYGEDWSSSNADRHDANFSRAVRITCDSISGLPVLVKQKSLRDGEEIWEVNPDHEINNIIRQPNPILRWDEITRHAIQSLMLHGNGEWVVELMGTKPAALWPAIPGRIRVVTDGRGIPTSYMLRQPDNTETPLKLEEVIWYRLYDMRSPFLGAGLVEPIRDEMETSHDALEFHKQHFKHGIHSDLFFLNEGIGQIPDNEKAAFRESLETGYSGVENAGKFPVLPEGLKPWERASGRLRDAAFEPLARFNREQIYAVAGIPPSVGGVYEYGDYANAVMQDKSFWTYSLKPFISLLESTLKHQLLDRYYRDDDLKIEFDLSRVTALQEDGLVKAQRNEILVRSRIMVVNEVRAKEYDMPPAPWGDEPYNAPAPVAPGQESGTDEEQEQTVTVEQVLGQRTPMHRAAEWFAFDRRVKSREEAYMALLRRYFRGQMGRVIANLNHITHQGMFMSMLAFAPDDPDEIGGIFKITEENEALETDVKPFMKKTVKGAGQDAVARAGLVLDFNVNDPHVAVIISKLTNRSKKINDATWKDIKGLLREAYDGNKTHSELVKGIKELYGEYGYARAEMIARTEMAGAVNAGANEGYRQGGIEKKEWLASIDERTRDAHATADGQVVSTEQSFIVGGEMLAAPGDPGGSPENTINCRCTVLPVVD